MEQPDSRMYGCILCKKGVYLCTHQMWGLPVCVCAHRQFQLLFWDKRPSSRLQIGWQKIRDDRHRVQGNAYTSIETFFLNGKGQRKSDCLAAARKPNNAMLFLMPLITIMINFCFSLSNVAVSWQLDPAPSGSTIAFVQAFDYLLTVTSWVGFCEK